MEVNIEITEGCVNFSYLINDIEWVDLVDKESDNYNIKLVNNVCEELIEQAKFQYQLPHWIIEYLWDGTDDPYCTQYTFIELVKNNKNTKEECLGTCVECGDTIYRWKLTLKINEIKN